MLKKFVLNALSAFVGAWAAIILFITGCVILILGLIGNIAKGEMEKVSKHSVMKILLSGSIDEIEEAPRLDYNMLLAGTIEQPQTLKTLLNALEKAKGNKNIEALFIECAGVQAAPATLNALREGILEFKKCGKRVFAYGDNLSMGDYYVATAADVVYLNPGGTLDLQGINGTTLYFKDLLDKVGVDVEAIRVGTFKSAIEPYVQNEMSPAAKLQLDSLYGEMWNYILENVNVTRKVPAATVDSLVNNFLFLDQSKTAKKYKLVDDCLYYREVAKLIADYVGVSEIKDINFVSPDLVAGNVAFTPNVKKQIAVLYAVGEIGEYPGAGIDCHKLVPLIVGFAENENIGGLVLRVNSPGGSVFGSEQIGEALDYFQSKGKPLCVSMGDYAASGGYWISCGADRIYADPLTITGSIGIFGLVPNVERLMDKIGVHPQTTGTNPNAVFPSIFYPMSPEQSAALEKNIRLGYFKFISRVASGRDKSEDYIRRIAEGRVWNAIKAQELGLVDELGGLQDAIEWTKDKSGIEKAQIVYYPEAESNWFSMLSGNTALGKEMQMISDRLSQQNMEERLVKFIRRFLMQEHAQARSPYYDITL